MGKFAWGEKTRNRERPNHLGWSGINQENRDRFYFPDTSQTSAVIAEIVAWSCFHKLGKSLTEISDHLGFSRQMKPGFMCL